MIHFIETWQTYTTRTDALRWFYQTGTGVLADGGALMGGTSASLLNARVPVRDRLRLGFWHECRKRPPTVTNSSFIHLPFGGDSNAYNQIGLGMNPDGTISVFCGKNFTGLGGVTLGSGATVWPVGDRHWIELDVHVSTTAGSVDLRVNGQLEFQISGVRTCNPLMKPFIDRVTICGGANVSSHWFGGLYVGDGAEGWMGPSEAYLDPVTPLVGTHVARPAVETLRPM